MKKNLNITIFGNKEINKIDLIENYIKDKKFGDRKQKKDCLSFVKTFKDNNSMKLNIHEISDQNDKKAKDISSNQCVIIMFDMTKRECFEEVIDKWIKTLRDNKYNNSIILLGTKNPAEPNALPMTDEEEIKALIDVTEIKGQFFDIANKNSKEISNLIDQLIETSYEEAKSNMNKKDCVIF